MGGACLTFVHLLPHNIEQSHLQMHVISYIIVIHNSFTWVVGREMNCITFPTSRPDGGTLLTFVKLLTQFLTDRREIKSLSTRWYTPVLSYFIYGQRYRVS